MNERIWRFINNMICLECAGTGELTSNFATVHAEVYVNHIHNRPCPLCSGLGVKPEYTSLVDD